MWATAENVHFGRHAGGAERAVVDDAVLVRHGGIFGGVKQKRRRRFGRNLQFIGKLADKVRGRVVAEQVAAGACVREGLGKGNDRVRKNGEVGSRADTRERVGGVGVTCDEVRRQRGGQVPAGGKANDPDAVGIDFPPIRFGADDANCAGDVVERRRVVIARRDTVTENKCGDSVIAGPVGDLLAFMIDGKVAIAASGADKQRGAGS